MALQRSMFERWNDDAEIEKEASCDKSKGWETNERVFKTGLEIIASTEDLKELYNSFQTSDGNGKDCGLDNMTFDEFLEIVEIWPADNSFCLEDLTLYTHTNTETGNKVFYWNYGLGGNDYGTYHFLLKDEPRSSSIHFMTNMDGDLSFLGDSHDKFAQIESWPDKAQTTEILNLIAFYKNIEDSEEYSNKSTPL